MNFTNSIIFKKVIKPYNVLQQQSDSYDLKLDHRILRDGEIETTLDEDPYIYPLEFILASTVEYVEIPRGILGKLSGKSTNARLGLAIEDAGLIDSGFRGNITLELFNKSRKKIDLRKIPLIAQLELQMTEPYGELYNGHYQGQVGVTKAWFKDD